MNEPTAETPKTIEDLFREFLDAVRVAPDIVAVNIAAGLAWQAFTQMTG